ncbi:PREDICTED: uncharacterized protein LOC18599231 isoform X2 [Theobroma cacao]|uniref:Uncharacterized protein LOC18599231 isoform X2 n=1 Tax=Theobroma cacao TaxID=3641 RepID=A0AB32WEY2_THECC|nr:PREDICTED: uncharacterized protein LOC18599231 isoform X2 [Theobroma cacao]
MDLKHFSHDHQLVFIQEWSRASEEEEEEGACCFACEERVEGPCYCCSGCKFFLHKTCAELELSPEMPHEPAAGTSGEARLSRGIPEQTSFLRM